MKIDFLLTSRINTQYREYAFFSNHNMKTTILTLFLFLSFISFGQNNSTKEIEPLKTIASKTLPDTDLEYSINGIVLRFSKSLTLEYWDSLFLENYKTIFDTLAYSKQDLENLTFTMKSIRNHLSGSGIIKLTVPLDFNMILDKDLILSIAIFGGVNGFYDDIICQMLDAGEFNIFSNGVKLHSVIKVRVVETVFSSRSENIRYYSVTSKELKTCCPCEYVLGDAMKKNED
ncbi:MAG: hypothetical protein CVT94_16205 [Bacteroidetes bacterium HGW-Bacteroidetes-11]|nr:MAG: hypothetical protein CVT94_16205 [Bacteroidetes bacterium HGW-Bacteroidetes-11]